MWQNVPSGNMCSPPPEFLGFFLESTWGTGRCWAMKFLSWFQTSVWGIENRDIKLSPHPIPAKVGEYVWTGACLHVLTGHLEKWEKWDLYFDRRRWDLKTQMKLHTDPAPPAEVSFFRREINEWCFDATDRPRRKNSGEGGRINNPGQTLPLSFYLLHPGKHKLSEQMFWPPSIQALTGHTSWLHGHWSMVIPCNAGPACFGKWLIDIVLIYEDKDINWNESIVSSTSKRAVCPLSPPLQPF